MSSAKWWPFCLGLKLLTKTFIFVFREHDVKVRCIWDQGPVSPKVSPSQFKFDGNFVSLSSRFLYSDRYKILYMAVVACAKICRDLIASKGIVARRSLHRIRTAGKKSLVKRARDPFRDFHIFPWDSRIYILHYRKWSNEYPTYTQSVRWPLGPP